jgi:hypothetical protein
MCAHPKSSCRHRDEFTFRVSRTYMCVPLPCARVSDLDCIGHAANLPELMISLHRNVFMTNAKSSSRPRFRQRMNVLLPSRLEKLEHLAPQRHPEVIYEISTYPLCLPRSHDRQTGKNCTWLNPHKFPIQPLLLTSSMPE